MPENENRGLHLRTKLVFIDTQVFRRARFDWNGRSLSKLIEFAKQGQLRLLVTDVTIREVKSQLQELLIEANSSLIKHSGILEQLGASVAIECVVCIENLIRFECLTESHNVKDDGRTAMLLSDAVGRAIQIEEPA
jgi:PIN domain